MIRTLTGTVQAVTDQEIILSLGAISFSLQVCNPEQFQKVSTATLQIYLHWNPEQGPSLFGFANDLERSVFLLFISCAGVGPKLGLAALSHLGAEQVLRALQTGNEKVLSQISGIGSKKAEQIIAHLKHKAQKLHVVTPSQAGAVLLTEQWNDVQQALGSLNYTRTEIMHAMQHIRQQTTDGKTPVSFDYLMRQALSFLAKKT